MGTIQQSADLKKMRIPKLKFLHSADTLSRAKLELFRRISTDDLRASLAPGQPGSLKVRGDGTVLDGHHRAGILPERGENIDELMREHNGKAAMKSDLFWIPGPWRGKLAVSTRPRGGDWLDDEVQGWRDAGIDAVVSLLEKDEAVQLQLERERSSAESKGLRFLSFPIPDRGVPASTRDALGLLADLTAMLKTGKNVAIHCRQGIGRSGLVAAASLMTSGIDAREAVDAVTKARGLTVPETPGQLQWLDRLATEYLALAS